MLSTRSLAEQLRHDYPHFKFLEGTDFRWSPSVRTIYFKPSGESSLLLHELAHALLGHGRYTRDIELIEMEQEAWAYAVSRLGHVYGVDVKADVTEDHLDSYRDWLHARSTCPKCSSTGVQVSRNEYKCLACNSRWQVNEARTCALRRYVQH